MVKHEDERAFPVTMYNADGSTITNLGMTLRDYFAAKAMSAIFGQGINECCQAEFMATAAYKMADAMLAERAK